PVALDLLRATHCASRAPVLRQTPPFSPQNSCGSGKRGVSPAGMVGRLRNPPFSTGLAVSRPAQLRLRSANPRAWAHLALQCVCPADPRRATILAPPIRCRSPPPAHFRYPLRKIRAPAAPEFPWLGDSPR